MKHLNIIAVLCILIISNSCIDKVWPDVDKYENILVVDGLLTDSDDPTTVKLSYSSSINSAELIPASGAELYLTSNIQDDVFF